MQKAPVSEVSFKLRCYYYTISYERELHIRILRQLGSKDSADTTAEAKIS